MYIFKQIEELQALLEKQRLAGKTIGFVPTMGALHEGHMSLIKMSNDDCDFTVCSVFVNPTQFDNPDDLQKYPDAFKQDVEMLLEKGCHVLFAPDVGVIYPNGAERIAPFEFGKVAAVLEGSFRPGHFDGMAQVVKRLLEIVEPSKLFMGQKDFQQQLIVRSLIDKMNIQTELVRCPIIREENGLAMSSRNRRLNEYEIEEASTISKELFRVKDLIETETFEQIKKQAIANIESGEFLKVEYLEIVDANTLLEAKSYSRGQEYLVCAAVFCGTVRLIDNVLIS